MTVDITSPSKTLFSGNASLLKLPGVDGLFEILENHASIVAALTKGKVKIISEEEIIFLEINGGVVEVLKNNVHVLTE